MTKNEAITKAIFFVGGLRASGAVIKRKAEEILRSDEATIERLTDNFGADLRFNGHLYPWAVTWQWKVYHRGWYKLGPRVKLYGAARKNREEALKKKAYNTFKPYLDKYIKEQTTIAIQQVYAVRKTVQHVYGVVHDCRTYEGQPNRNMQEPIKLKLAA